MSDAERPRRRVLNFLLGTGLLGSILSFFYPVLRFIMPPAVAQPIEDSVVAGKVGELPPNSGKIFKFGSRPGILIRTPSGDYRAFDAVCTHLSCIVQYRSDFAHVWCACHNGHYDLTGKNIAGPPPRPLPRFKVAIRGADIVVMRDA